MSHGASGKGVGMAEPANDIVLLREIGVAERWTVSVKECETATGFDVNYEPGDRPHHALCFNLFGGRPIAHHGRTSRTTPQGSDVIAYEGIGAGGRWFLNGQLRYCQFSIPDALLIDAAATVPNSQLGLLQQESLFASDRMLREAAETYARRAFSGEPTALEMDARAILLVLQLVRAASAAPAVPERRTKGGLSGWEMHLLRDFLLANLHRDVRLDELAGLINRSRYHVSRAFHLSVGLPIHIWVMRERIRLAQRLMDDASLPLSHVAHLVGYASQQSFSAAFKNVTGVAPGRWRGSYRQGSD